MAETTTASATATTPKAPPSVTLPSSSSSSNKGALLSPNGNIVVWVQGRVNTVNKVAQTKDGRAIFETVVFLPAVDPYSQPRRYCVSSYGVVGRPGEDVEVCCELVCQPWRPRNQYNQGNQGNRGGYNGGYNGGNNAQQSGGDSGPRWHYPHYLWAIG